MILIPTKRQDGSIFELFKNFYRDLKTLSLDEIESIYTSEVVFKDPIHEIRGINALHAYMSDLCANLTSGRFEYLDEIVGHDRAYIKWDMHFAHPKLGGKNVIVRGVTQVHFNEKIFYHEDVYDMSEMVYDHIPILGGTTRWLKKRLARTGSE